MAACGLGALVAAVALVLGGRPRPVRIVGGAIVLGVASIAAGAVDVVPGRRSLLMVPIGAGGIAMAATANATIQLAVPDGLRGRVMSVYTTVFSASMPIGGLLDGCPRVAPRASSRRSPSAACCRSVGAGSAGLVPADPSPRRRRSPSAGAVAGPLAASRRGQSTAPNTSAAFSPPNPNEVLSTRR